MFVTFNPLAEEEAVAEALLVLLLLLAVCEINCEYGE